MTDDARSVPADLLLLRERRRRLGIAETRADAPVADAALVMESDAIIAGSPLTLGTGGTGGVKLYRPLGSVMLSGIPWSGAVDHETLQNAILCAPPRAAGAPAPPRWLAAVATFALSAPPAGEPALTVTLGEDDIAALDRLGTQHARATTLALARAAALPATIEGADAATVGAAALLLGAYRRASLVFAWQAMLLGDASDDAAHERDASAVQVVSVLRALLGEN